MGCIRTCGGPVTATKLRAEGSERGVDNRVNMNLPTLLAKCARGMQHPAASPGGYDVSRLSHFLRELDIACKRE